MQAKRFLLVVVAVGLLAALSWAGVSLWSGSRALASGDPQQKWEYMVVGINKAANMWGSAVTQLVKAKNMPFDLESGPCQNALDAAGRAGWELVAVDGILGGDQEFIFKRPLP